MKIQVKAAELAKKLSRALSVIPAKPTIPVLAYVKLEATSATTATMTGMDLGQAVIQNLSIALASSELGAILLPAAALSGLIAPLPSDAVVTIDNQDKTLVVTSNSKLVKNVKLPGMDLALFPAVDPRPATQANFNSAAFKKVVFAVEFAAPPKEGRSVVASVLLESTAAYLRGVATDGSRIAVAQVNGAGVGDISIQLPKNFLPVLKELPGEVIQYSRSENNLFFASEHETVFVRIPTTSFPGYQKPIAFDQFTNSFTVPVPMFKSALDVIAVTAGGGEQPAAILSVGNGELSLFSSDAAVGEAESVIDVVLEGQPNKVKLNLKFLVDFLGKVEGAVRVQMVAPTAVVKLTGGEAGEYQYFVMPMLENAQPAAEEKKEAKGGKKKG